MALLELRDVSRGYGETPVLRNLSLSVNDGEFLAILGALGIAKLERSA